MFGSYREYVPRIIDMLCWSRDLLVLLVPGRSRVGLAPSLRPSSSYRSPERPPNQSHTLPFQKLAAVTVWLHRIVLAMKKSVLHSC